LVAYRSRYRDLELELRASRGAGDDDRCLGDGKRSRERQQHGGKHERETGRYRHGKLAYGGGKAIRLQLLSSIDELVVQLVCRLLVLEVSTRLLQRLESRSRTDAIACAGLGDGQMVLDRGHSRRRLGRLHQDRQRG